MSSFKDTEGRLWSFNCNVFTLARCKSEAGVDLASAIEQGSKVIEEITEDVSIFFAVLCSLLKDQMKEAGVDEQGLGEAINDEDIVIEATQAMVRAIIDFFPPKRSKALRKAFDQLWNLTREKAELEADKAIATIDSLDFEKMSTELVESMGSSLADTSTVADS
tara:strand:+ start:110 stop:601 length:492 start_codon:yes stop_codon:yes gene_type:complete